MTSYTLHIKLKIYHYLDSLAFLSEKGINHEGHKDHEEENFRKKKEERKKKKIF
jgi:hypothetical protein